MGGWRSGSALRRYVGEVRGKNLRKGYVYILRSLKDKNFYIGSTVDLERRYLQHSQGKVTSTKRRRPLELLFFQEFESISKARKIENRLKKLKRKDIVAKIVKEGKISLAF